MVAVRSDILTEAQRIKDAWTLGMSPSTESIEHSVASLASLVGEAERDPIAVYQTIADEARACFGATSAAIWLPSDTMSHTPTLNAIAISGEISPDILRVDIPVEGTFIGRAFEEQSPVVVDDFRSAETPAISKALTQVFNVRSAVIVPLHSKGLLTLMSDKPRAFTDEEVTLSQSFASLASAAYGMSERAALVERERLMAELHDGAIQVLYGALMELEHAKEEAGSEELGGHISLSAELIREGLDELREAVLSMDTARQSLAHRIRRTAMLLGKRTFIGVDFDGEDLDPNHPWTEDLSRIMLEAVSNAIRHGKATNVSVAVTNNADQFVMKITDDGAGFDLTTKGKGLGLVNMPRRADRIGAKLEIESEPGNGTTVIVTIDKTAP